MRISTHQMFDNGSRNIISGQGSLYNIQNQLSTGRRILSPQDDPVGASQVLLDTQAQAVIKQFADNQANAGDQLALEEDRLKSVVSNIIYNQSQIVGVNNSSLSDSQRKFFANDLQNQLQFLLGIANSADAAGHYLFSGYQGTTEPFQMQTNGSIQYMGDQGQRVLQVGASRIIPVSDSGHDIFERIRTGNGTFATGGSPTNANTGTGLISTGSVTDPTAWAALQNLPYTITFGAGGSTYTITDSASNTVGTANSPFVSGGAIAQIPGATFAISGSPAANDVFTISPSVDKSLFQTMQDLIGALNTPTVGNPATLANMQNIINANQVNLDRALENVSAVQSSIGSRRSELSALINVSQDLDVSYTAKISKLQDIDYAKTISDFMSQQNQLTAAQKSFAQVSGLSLFNYI